ISSLDLAIVLIDPARPSMIYGVTRAYRDAFVAKLNAEGSTLAYSFQLNGGGSDYATGIAVNRAGEAYVAGVTDSPDFPTQNPFQAVITPSGDGFLAKIRAD